MNVISERIIFVSRGITVLCVFPLMMSFIAIKKVEALRTVLYYYKGITEVGPEGRNL